MFTTVGLSLNEMRRWRILENTTDVVFTLFITEKDLPLSNCFSCKNDLKYINTTQ
jgi:hypothetical protein